MIIGCVKETKSDEYRVGLSPESARAFIEHGHEVLIEKGAGVGSGFSDEMYQEVGCKLLDNKQDIWQQTELMVKVKEPTVEEYQYLREGLILFAYLHLANDQKLTEMLMEKKVTAIAYETIQYENQNLPLLKPMSMIAGRLAPQQGAKYLEKHYGGKGILLSGVDGTNPAEVLIIGSGNVGANAVSMAHGLGANVTVISTNVDQLQEISEQYHDRVKVYKSSPKIVEASVIKADLIILSALVVGGVAPIVITRDMVKKMEPGSVIVDVAVDHGGNSETTRATTHGNPIYVDEGVIHYCVSNMPGAVPRSASLALNHATLPFGLEIANKGFKQSVLENKAIYNGVNTYGGYLVYDAIGKAFNISTKPLSEILND